MKKIICIFLALAMSFVITGCGSNDTIEANKNVSGNGITNIHVDLTQLSNTMVYSEVYNMVTTPDNYIGKTVKMSGTFSVYEDPDTNKIYLACLIADAAACCSQGIEFVLKGEHKYPDDYPEADSPITVIGTFSTYFEDEYQYCQLINAELIY